MTMIIVIVVCVVVTIFILAVIVWIRRRLALFGTALLPGDENQQKVPQQESSAQGPSSFIENPLAPSQTLDPTFNPPPSTVSDWISNVEFNTQPLPISFGPHEVVDNARPSPSFMTSPSTRQPSPFGMVPSLPLEPSSGFDVEFHDILLPIFSRPHQVVHNAHPQPFRQSSPFVTTSSSTRQASPFLATSPRTQQPSPFVMTSPRTQQSSPFVMTSPRTQQSSPRFMRSPRTRPPSPSQQSSIVVSASLEMMPPLSPVQISAHPMPSSSPVHLSAHPIPTFIGLHQSVLMPDSPRPAFLLTVPNRVEPSTSLATTQTSSSLLQKLTKKPPAGR